MGSSELKTGDEVGFAGLLSWVGKSDSLIGRIEEQHRGKLTSGSESRSQRQYPGRQERADVLNDSTIGTQPTKMPAKKKAVIWAAVIVGGGILIALANSNDTSQNSGHAAQTTESSSGPPEETVPPVGNNNALDLSELHYCLAQGIRIDAAHNVVNQYVQAQVDRFNSMVTDFNSRCGQFRYRESEMGTAKSDVESYRALYQTQGRSQFQ